MPAVESTKEVRRRLEDEFGPDFPLTVTRRGYLVKKINKRQYVFGRIDKAQEALSKYEKQKDLIRCGLNPELDYAVFNPDPKKLTVDGLINKFLQTKKIDPELVEETHHTYKAILKIVQDTFGKQKLVMELGPTDFAILRARLGKGVKFSSLSTRITHVRACFSWGIKKGVIEKTEMELFSDQFQKPRKKAVRLQNTKKPKKLVSHEQFNALLGKANLNMAAILHLGANCGFGPKDIASLQFDQVDLKKGIVELTRLKTGVERRAFLWDETVNAIKEAIKHRVNPANESDTNLIFINSKGMNFITKFTGDSKTVPISREFTRLKRSAKLDHIKGLSFYSLRHSFQTYGDNETRDFEAVRSLMGHVDNSISGNYRQFISDERLKNVSQGVKGYFVKFQESA